MKGYLNKDKNKVSLYDQALNFAQQQANALQKNVYFYRTMDSGFMTTFIAPEIGEYIGMLKIISPEDNGQIQKA